MDDGKVYEIIVPCWGNRIDGGTIGYWDFEGWQSSPRIMRRIVNLAIPVGWILSIPFAILFGSDGSIDVISSVILMIIGTVIIVILYFVMLRWLKRLEPEEWKHFTFPYNKAIGCMDVVLTRKGIQHTRASLDEYWFDKDKKKLGIDRDVLDFKDLHSTVFVLNDGALRIMVSDISSDGKMKIAVSLWPMTGDHIQFLESLKVDIDAELTPGPL